MLVKRVLDSPTITLSQNRAQLRLATGKTVSVATLCRALHENGFTRQRVRNGSPGRWADARPSLMCALSLLAPGSAHGFPSR